MLVDLIKQTVLDLNPSRETRVSPDPWMALQPYFISDADETLASRSLMLGHLRIGATCLSRRCGRE
jgi:hypothetical protein